MSDTLSAGSTRRPMIADGVADLIGATPLLRLSRYLDRSDVALFAKLEAFNPGGSAKDRPARHMVEQALASGHITTQSTLVESSSGNMGIGLAQICRYHGIALICVVDVNAQSQNVAIMAALGATIHRVTEPLEGDFLAARMAAVESIVAETPGAVWLNQYMNQDNPGAHRIGAIVEIDEAMEGRLDTLFVATSSTGTAQGCRDFLAERGRDTRVIAVDAEGSTLFGGRAGARRIPGMGAGRVPELARDQTFSRVVRVGDGRCVAGCRRAAEREALLVGGSAGGVLEAVRRMADELAGQRVAVILHDSGTRYLDTIYDDEWVQTQLGLSPSDIRRLMENIDE